MTSTKVVIELMNKGNNKITELRTILQRESQNSGHHVYMDNYYVSPELFTELELLNTYPCGTWRKNHVGVQGALKN